MSSNAGLERAIGKVEGTVDGLKGNIADLRNDQNNLRNDVMTELRTLNTKIDGHARTEAAAYNAIRTKVATISVTVSLIVAIGGFFLKDYVSSALAMITH